MRINKISKDTPNIYKAGDYLQYYRIADEHIVMVDNSFGKVFPANAGYDDINDYVFDIWDTICCYNVEDKGEYWEFVEEETDDEMPTLAADEV